MTNAIDKAQIKNALTMATRPGYSTAREVDKVMAAINRGEFDLPDEPVTAGPGVLLNVQSEDGEFDIQEAGEELAHYVAEEAMEEAAIVKDWLLIVDYIGEDTGSEGFVKQTGVTYASNATGGMSAALGMMSIVRHRLLQVDADDEAYGEE